MNNKINYLLADIYHRDFKKLFKTAKWLFLNKFFDYPAGIMLETTNRCNCRCTICPIHTTDKCEGMMDSPYRDMTFVEFKQILDGAKGFGAILSLFDRGEPFLTPELEQMVEYSHKLGYRTHFSTNAAVMTPEISEMLLRQKCDHIIISFDGHDKKTHEEIRVGSVYEKTVENINYLIRRKNELGYKKPIIQMQFIVTKTNKHGIEAFKKQWEDKVEELHIRSLHLISKNVEDLKRKTKLYFIDGEPRRYDLVEGLPVFRNRSATCPYYKSPVIQVDGTVVACCYDYSQEGKLANALETPFAEIWKSKKGKYFRHELIKKRKFNICKGCGI